MQPRYFIVTLYSGEPDFDHHVKSLNDQGVEFTHKIVKFMPKLEAHNELYKAFNDAPAGLIRAKIDADVVLNDGVLNTIAKRMNPTTWLDAQTFDHLSESSLHAGVAFYGDAVKFVEQTNSLKTDRGVAQGARRASFGVIGSHAKYANEWTAFHYGFHRGLKSQLPVYANVVRAYKKHGDRPRLMAIRGFELGQSDRYIDWHLGRSPCPRDHDYTAMKALFDEFNVDEPPVLTRTWR